MVEGVVDQLSDGGGLKVVPAVFVVFWNEDSDSRCDGCSDEEVW